MINKNNIVNNYLHNLLNEYNMFLIEWYLCLML